MVIDSGLSRVPRFDPASGLTRLETVRVTKASADQRRGRAGRTEPGVCYRLWDEPETRALIPFGRPEILETDLSGLALDLARWGVRDAAGLAFLDPPPAAALQEARSLLQRLQALDGSGALSAHGRRMAELPLPPASRTGAEGGEEGAPDTPGLRSAHRARPRRARIDWAIDGRVPRDARLAPGTRCAGERCRGWQGREGRREAEGRPALLLAKLPDGRARSGKPGEYRLASGAGISSKRTPCAQEGCVGDSRRRGADRILLAAPSPGRCRPRLRDGDRRGVVGQRRRRLEAGGGPAGERSRGAERSPASRADISHRMQDERARSFPLPWASRRTACESAPPSERELARLAGLGDDTLRASLDDWHSAAARGRKARPSRRARSMHHRTLSWERLRGWTSCA